MHRFSYMNETKTRSFFIRLTIIEAQMPLKGGGLLNFEVVKIRNFLIC